MAGGPPAALLQFLGEAPSAAALRRPDSSAGAKATPSSARDRREDSSPDTPGLPHRDGGFDECRDYSGATAAENDTLGSSVPDEGRTRQHKSSSSKPPRAAKGSPDTPKAARAAASAAGYAGGAPSKRTTSRGPEIEDLSKTCTPQPAGLSSFLGEGSASPNASSGRPIEPSGGSQHQRLSDSGGSTHSGGAGRSGYSGTSRPRSGSRNRNMAASNSSGDFDDSSATRLTKASSKAAAALDPLGTSGGKRRFGGRG